MEVRIHIAGCEEFIEIQGVHLALVCHRIHGEQWVRQFMSKILHITHSQWIFKNFTLYDRRKSWLRRKEMSKVMEKFESYQRLMLQLARDGL